MTLPLLLSEPPTTIAKNYEKNTKNTLDPIYIIPTAKLAFIGNIESQLISINNGTFGIINNPTMPIEMYIVMVFSLIRQK